MQRHRPLGRHRRTNVYSYVWIFFTFLLSTINRQISSFSVLNIAFSNSAKTCRSFERPAHGTLTPAQCIGGDIYAGERCILHCDPGFKPINRRIAVCGPHMEWLPSANLTCMPVPALAIKPYIQCPPDATMTLTAEQRTMLIRMEQPKTNVDFQK